MALKELEAKFETMEKQLRTIQDILILTHNPVCWTQGDFANVGHNRDS